MEKRPLTGIFNTVNFSDLILKEQRKLDVIFSSISSFRSRCSCATNFNFLLGAFHLKKLVAFATNTRVQNDFFQTCSNSKTKISTGYFVEIDWKYWTKTACNGQDIIFNLAISCWLCTPPPPKKIIWFLLGVYLPGLVLWVFKPHSKFVYCLLYIHTPF